jgi:hypothetical protein
MRYADLHLHTFHSDGIRSPLEVVERVVAAKLGILAISDHDNIAAYHEARDAARAHDLTFVPAAELSALLDGVDIHILAYGFDPDDRAIEARLAAFRETRAQRGDRMVEKLVALGIPIRKEQVARIAGEGAVGRPHVARALIESGVVTTVQEAFDLFLRPGCPGYVDKERFSVEEAVALVRAAGGVTSIAHPSLYPDHRRMLPRILDMGVDGIEVFHPDVNDDDRFHYQRLAKERGLIVSGGSDDHGYEGRKTIGSVRVPEKAIVPIVERAR